jgi:hypothetical protein
MNFRFNPLNPTTLVLAAVLIALIIYGIARKKHK